MNNYPNTPLPELANNPPAFDVAGDSFDLYFDDWRPLSLMDDATAVEWTRLHPWEREQFEASFSKPKVLVRDKPMIETTYYDPIGSDYTGYITTASMQPHHREIAEPEHLDVLYIDGALANADTWRLPERALRHRPIILCRPGEHLLGARTAVELALYGERCCWIDCGRDLIEWQKRLSKFELIPLKRIYQ